jgi:hypothetical protein
MFQRKKKKGLQEVKTRISCLTNFFFLKKSCRLLDVKKCCTDGQYGACALHAGYLNLQTHAHNMQFLLLLHHNGCTNAPHWYVRRTMHALLNVTLVGPSSSNQQACSDHSTAMHWRVQIKKLLIKQVSLHSSYSLPLLGTNILPSTL